jgi:hypothetical protein
MYQFDVMSDNHSRRRVVREWPFSPKDVVIIVCMALAMSGLMGLGVIMALEIVASLLG